MVTIYNIKRNDLKNEGNYILCELRGLSTDTKPTQIEENIIENGSVFIEIDTQDVFIYDGENETWLPEAEIQEVTPQVNIHNLQTEENIEEPIIENNEER